MAQESGKIDISKGKMKGESQQAGQAAAGELQKQQQAEQVTEEQLATLNAALQAISTQISAVQAANAALQAISTQGDTDTDSDQLMVDKVQAITTQINTMETADVDYARDSLKEAYQVLKMQLQNMQAATQKLQAA